MGYRIAYQWARARSVTNPSDVSLCTTGLVAKVYPADKLVEEAVAMAMKIGSMSLPIAIMAKEAVNTAFEGTLKEGVHLERRMFHSTFALVRGSTNRGDGNDTINE